MIHVRIRVPTCLYDEGIVRDGIGVKDRGSCFSLVFAGAVPRDSLAILNGTNDTTMRVIAVIAIIITVVDDLHSDAYSNHVAGSRTRSITAAVATAANFGARTTTLGFGTGSHHRRPSVGCGRFGRLSRFRCFFSWHFLRGSVFRNYFNDGFLHRSSFLRGRFFRSLCFNSWLFRQFCNWLSCAFCRLFRHGGRLRFICRSLCFINLRSECSYCAKRQTGDSHHKN